MNRKICFVGSEITPSEGSTFVGGHVNTVVGLCKGLSDLGWEIHIVTTPSRFLRETPHDFPWAKIHVIKANGKHNSLSYDVDFLIQAVRTIEQLNSQGSFDLVHAHSGYFSLAIIPALIRRRLGIPALFSLYCPASLLPSKLPIDSYGIKVLSLGLDKIIAVTENVKKSLTKCGVDDQKIEVLPSCFDEKVFHPDANNLKMPQRVVEQSKNRKVLFIGNIDRTKGLDIFLAAAKSVLRANPETRFVITLHEPHEVLQSAKVLASRSLGSSVEIFGVVNNMAKLMANVDLVVAPFRSTEGISDIPLIVLEAMALGKPIVASNLEGIKEAVIDGKNGILVNLDNSGELANAITILLNDPNLREEISNQAVSYVKRYSYSEISKRLSDLYMKIMEKA
jgi:glycosyltransferase involved in cell wall biosynthesis